MRRSILTLLVATTPAVVSAQITQQERSPLPRDVRREVVTRWNTRGATALVSSERLQIDAGHEVRGDVLVRNGPAVVAGHVAGSLLALNASVTLLPSARIDGDILVVGGELTGRYAARVDGSTRIYRQSFEVKDDGNRIADAESDGAADEGWWQRLEHRHQGSWMEALRIVQAGPYNRVEGLPIELGPVIQQQTTWGSLRLEGAMVLRTGSSFATSRSDVGHTVRAEVRFGQEGGFGIGGRVYSDVEPVEGWQLSDLETALAAFVSRRDYRDYYERHGGNGYVTLYGARNLSLTASYGAERWSTRDLRNPFTLFDVGKSWRPSPVMDEGLFHIFATRLSFDTRTDPEDPWSGWYLNADVERGRGTVTQVAPMSQVRLLNVGETIDYTRGFFDFRRYNRLGPAAQLNVRAVLGGWLGGDALPLERRVSAEGPGVLPGFDFRSTRAGPDVGTCNAPIAAAGRPAECDRIAVAQVEYRGDLKLDVLSRWEVWPRHYRTAHGDAVWVLFADAGRGWRVGQPNGSMTYERNDIPPFSTFRTDAGVGLDIGGIGIYAAKALSTPREPLNFFLRLRHRF
jgi:hypothetical protein